MGGRQAWTILAFFKQCKTNSIPGLQYCNTIPYQYKCNNKYVYPLDTVKYVIECKLCDEISLSHSFCIIVQLSQSLTLKLAYTPTTTHPPTTTNFWTTYRQHRELKFGMQAYFNPSRSPTPKKGLRIIWTGNWNHCKSVDTYKIQLPKIKVDRW